MNQTRPPRLAAALAPLVGLLALLAGCRIGPPATPTPPTDVVAGPDDAARAANYPALDRDAAHALQAALVDAPGAPAAAKPPARPLTVLALSGGGQYSAYAAGVLCGWSSTGKRPQFDVVNGISSGSLLASIAFLGPKYDPLMTRVFTTLKTSDLFRYRPVLNLVRHYSLATADPMVKLIEAEVNAEFIDDMRAQHRAGRRLFVGTGNLHTRRLVVWDLGAIACSGRPDADDLVRRILLASAAIPGIVPAVDFDIEVNGVRYVESHVDGGAIAETFLRLGPDMPRPDPANPAAKWLAGSTLYSIAGGKLYADPYSEQPGFLDRTVGTVSTTLHALYRADLWRMYAYCLASGMAFKHTAIPQELPIPPKSTRFDPAAMRAMYAAGYDFGRGEQAWRTAPPGEGAGEEDYPRGGFVFGSQASRER